MLNTKMFPDHGLPWTSSPFLEKLIVKILNDFINEIFKVLCF